MKEIVTKIIIVVVFLLMEVLLMNWNTNKFLMSEADMVVLDEYAEMYQTNVSESDLTADMQSEIKNLMNTGVMAASFEGRKTDSELAVVSALAEIREKGDTEGYFLQAESLEATGIYKLLSTDYEGILRKGKTFNIFPRKMFTTETFLPTIYRGMYGQFYKAKLSDQEEVLVLVGCNDIEAAENGAYGNIIAKYHAHTVEGLEEKYQNEASDKLKQLESSMSTEGYINLGDTDWAERHNFGLFAMAVLKAAISTLAAAFVVWLVGLFWKD